MHMTQINVRQETETATFAGGCFWCTEAIFQRLNGVTKVTSGYTGGKEPNPTYEMVSSGTTGFMEAIQIEFDPTVVSFQTLLDIFWATHDPTTLNRQGYDEGTQYHSAIFFHSKRQEQEAITSKTQLEQKGVYTKPIVTDIFPYINFYPAEAYHQNYYNLNKSTNRYCPLIIDPKIQKLLHSYPELVQEKYK